MIWENGRYMLTDQPEDQDLDAIYQLLLTTYWASERTREEMERIVQHSLCFSLFNEDKELVGFVRVITDFTRMTWVSDMVLKGGYRGKQLGQWMMVSVMNHPDLIHTQFALQTKDAQPFYEKLGFSQRASLMSTSVSFL